MGSVYPRRKNLWIRFKGPDGWTQQKTPYHLGEEKKARKLLLDVEANVTAGIKFDPKNASGPVTVAAYTRKWLEDRRSLVADSKNDEARLKHHVLPAIGAMRLDEVRPRHPGRDVPRAAGREQARTEVDPQHLQHGEGVVPGCKDGGPPHR